MKTRLVLLAATSSLSGPRQAQNDSRFYEGKQVRMVIRSGVGGGYDLYSRRLARHIGKHIPGNPAVVPINMPAAAASSPRTSSPASHRATARILTMVSQGLPTDQALGLTPSFKADLRTFNWIGNMGSSTR